MTLMMLTRMRIHTNKPWLRMYWAFHFWRFMSSIAGVRQVDTLLITLFGPAHGWTWSPVQPRLTHSHLQ